MTLLLLGLVLVAVAAGAAAAAARRAELAARAAHELRGPLTAASLALHAGAADAVEAQLERVAVAVEDLERAARGRRPARRREAVDVAALLVAQAAAHRASAAHAGRTLRVLPAAPDVDATGDARLLRQAIGNLVANAL